MTELRQLYNRMIDSMGVEGLEMPFAAVKLYKKGSPIPDQAIKNEPANITLTCCQAIRHASLGDAVFLTRNNIGCIAAAISLGLVDQNEKESLEFPRVYTEIMREQSGRGKEFSPPSPEEFTNGTVYACRDSGRMEYALFGENDSGRFKDVETAKRAIKNMIAIQPAIMHGVFVYSLDYDEMELKPDVIILTVRSVELARIIQAYQYITGAPVTTNMSVVRAVDSDMIARPYLTGEMNVSTFCVGARLIAKYEAEYMGVGMPYKIFKEIVEGMEESKTGFPFHMYPGA